MASGCVTRAGLVTTTCTRSIVIPPWMVLWSRCTMRWLPVTVWGHPASRSSRQQQSTSSSARGTTPSSSTIQRLSFLWLTAKSGLQPGSWRPPSRLPGPTCSCDPTHPDTLPNLWAWQSGGLLVQVNRIYIQPIVSKFYSCRSMQWPLLAWWISPSFTICCLTNYNSQFRSHLI